ncbi:MAG: hypothetical protein AB7O67_16210 [Vicinamibacterales bacterium]
MTRARRRPGRSTAVPAAAPAPAPATGAPRVVAATVVLTSLAAILERWWFPRAWNETGNPASVFYFGDVPAYLSYARAIALGQPYDNGIPFHPPGWPWTLSWVVGLVTSAAALKFAVAVLSGLGVGLAALLAWRLVGRGAMLATALLGVFHFGHIVAGSVPNSEALFGVLVVLALLAAERWFSAAGTRAALTAAALTGAVAGLAALVRAEFLLGGLLLAAAGWWQSRGRGWHGPAACLAGLALVLVPNTVANWTSLSAFNASHTRGFPGPLPRLAPVTSYGAFNFAMANHERADGGPNRDHPLLDACAAEDARLLEAGGLELACPAAYELYVDGYGIGAAWLLRHPLDTAGLWARKAWYAAGALAQGYMADDFGGGTSGVRRRVDMIDPAGRLLLPLHLALLVAGLVLLRHRPVALLLVGVPLATVTAATLLFYGYVRLVIPYLPAVWICQGAALAALGARVAPPAWQRRAPAAVLALAAVLLLVEGARLDTPRALQVDGTRQPDGTLLQDETLTLTRTR